MYSTTTLAKNSRFTGKNLGTHQLLDQAARKILNEHLPSEYYFPSSKEILQFEGARGPDCLKRKSPDDDDPTHMFDEDEGRELYQQIFDHFYNLVDALRKGDKIRASFETAWMSHKITDSLTPAHHFPLSEAREELMSNKEFVKIFGEPIKGIMHGRTLPETVRNNWLYWGAGGYFSKHVAYEYGVAIIAATMPKRQLLPKMHHLEFYQVDVKKVLHDSLVKVQAEGMYNKFRTKGWTQDLALHTKSMLLPEIVRALALTYFAAAEMAYHLNGVEWQELRVDDKENRKNSQQAQKKAGKTPKNLVKAQRKVVKSNGK